MRFILSFCFYLIGIVACLVSCNSKQPAVKPSFCKQEIAQLMELVYRVVYEDTAKTDRPFTNVDSAWLINSGYFNIFEYPEGLRLYSVNFDRLDSVRVSGNISLKGFTRLEHIKLPYQKVQSLHIADCPLLKTVYCQMNKTADIRIENCDSIIRLDLSDNKLKWFDAGCFPNLQTLSISHNELDTISFSNNQQIKYINVWDNNLSHFYYPGNSLERLNLRANRIKSINLNYTGLEELNLAENGLTTINTDSLSELIHLDLRENELTSINFRDNSNLKTLDISRNKLSKLDVGNLHKLEVLQCWGNNMWEAYVANTFNGREFIDTKEYGLRKIVLPRESSLRELACSHNMISSFELKDQLLLEKLSCNENRLTRLDVSKNTKLKELSCANNRLEALNLHNNPLLETLRCYNNNISRLDLNGNPLLVYINAVFNPIVQLNLNSLTVQNEKLEKDVPDTISVIRKSLQQILPEAVKFEGDTSNPNAVFLVSPKLGRYTPENLGYVDDKATLLFASSSAIAVGKFFDSNVFAAIYCYGSNALEFYLLDEGKWKLLSAFTTQIMPDFIMLEKLRNDSLPAFVLSTSPNMNGNQWKEAYVYKPDEQKISYAGSFNTSYEVVLADSTIRVEYWGSWYMAPERTVYKWIGDELIPVKKLSLPLTDRNKNTMTDERELWYYENFDSTFTGLKLVKKEFYGKKQEQFWDNFFTINNE